MRKKLVPEEKPICNVVTAYRERGNYLQRLEQFEKAIQAYNEALRWNSSDVRSLLGRSLARVKTTHYADALADAAKAAELEPNNLSASQIRAKANYEKCAFERALLLAHRGQRLRRLPPDFAECVRHAEETLPSVNCLRGKANYEKCAFKRELLLAHRGQRLRRLPPDFAECVRHAKEAVRECAGKSAGKMLSSVATLYRSVELKRESMDANAPMVKVRQSRMEPKPTQQVQEISRSERQRAEQISRLMASKYLERMAHDKYFLTALSKDERLSSANRQGSKMLQELANKALADVENRQAVLRERRPLYAARAAEAAARARLSRARKEQLTRAQRQHAVDAKRLVRAAQKTYEERDTAKCLESAEFAMEQIGKKNTNLLPAKEKFLQQLYDIVANTFLDQKRVKDTMSESDRERRAFILLGMYMSREPSRDSVLRARPPAPPRDAKQRLRTLERSLAMSTRAPERCYILHELARLLADTKQAQRARFFALKCQSESRTANQRIWLLNATFLLARCHLLQNNRPEARAALIEAAGLARTFGFGDVGAFMDTCVNISLEGEVGASEAALEKREKALVSLMQDDDLRSAAEHLFRRMSVIPAARRFSIMPGTRVEEAAPTAGRRMSINPKAQQPTRGVHKTAHPLGFQEFDI